MFVIPKFKDVAAGMGVQAVAVDTFRLLPSTIITSWSVLKRWCFWRC